MRKLRGRRRSQRLGASKGFNYFGYKLPHVLNNMSNPFGRNRSFTWVTKTLYDSLTTPVDNTFINFKVNSLNNPLGNYTGVSVSDSQLQPYYWDQAGTIGLYSNYIVVNTEIEILIVNRSQKDLRIATRASDIFPETPVAVTDAEMVNASIWAIKIIPGIDSGSKNRRTFKYKLDMAKICGETKHNYMMEAGTQTSSTRDAQVANDPTDSVGFNINFLNPVGGFGSFDFTVYVTIKQHSIMFNVNKLAAVDLSTAAS